MSEFLQTYGSWILVGVFLLLMLRMHTGGHGMGQHAQHTTRSEPHNTDAGASSTTASESPPVRRPSGGCH